MRVIFYPKEGSLYCRITINGDRKEFSAKPLDEERVEFRRGRAVGNGRTAVSINNYIDTVKVDLLNIYRDLCAGSSRVTSAKVRDVYLRKVRGVKTGLTLLEAIDKHIKKIIESDEYSDSSRKKFETIRDHISGYLRKNYTLDLLVEEINEDFINGFYDYLRDPHRRFKINNNTAVKYNALLGKIIRPFVRKRLIDDPYMSYEHRTKRGKIRFLDKSELTSIIEFRTTVERLERVRDSFLFQCCTGLAYCDARTITRDSIIIDINGNKWIYKDRGKTGVTSRIPLNPMALSLLEKYDYQIPFPSNQKFNAYLKELADLCGIKQNLTTHLARKTFATLMLNAGVPITSVAKMLGHTTTRTTEEIYAQVMNTTIYESHLNARFVLPEMWEKIS